MIITGCWIIAQAFIIGISSGVTIVAVLLAGVVIYFARYHCELFCGNCSFIDEIIYQACKRGACSRRSTLVFVRTRLGVRRRENSDTQQSKSNGEKVRGSRSQTPN